MEAPKTLQDAILYYSDEQVCIDTVAAMRWPGGVRCPRCPEDKSDNPYWLKTQKRWKCRSCRRQFSVKVATIFEDSPIPLQKWLPAVWMLVNDKNGISSHELHRALGVTQKTAWFMLHRIRLAMHSEPSTQASGEVEADETFVGGTARFMHKDRKRRIQAKRSEIRNSEASGHPGKTAVMGILDREARQIRAKVIPNVRREVLQEEILKNVAPGSALYTDDAGGYRYLPVDRFVHDVVDHEHQYVRGRVHTNGMENFWSLLKRSLKGTYVAVEPFHLDRYVDEQVFRFNNRATKDNPLNDADRFVHALAQVAGKRITYSELTGKVGTTETF